MTAGNVGETTYDKGSSDSISEVDKEEMVGGLLQNSVVNRFTMENSFALTMHGGYWLLYEQ